MRSKQILISLLMVLFTSFLSATIYEDGNTSDTSRWTAMSGDMSTILNIEDSLDPSNRVIKARSHSAKYKLDMDYATAPIDQPFTLKMLHTTGDYAIFIHLNTDNGLRILKYNNRSSGSTRALVGNFTKIGIAENAIQGAWSNLSLDFAADLAVVEPNNNIVSVEAFAIKGIFAVDNIQQGPNTSPNPTCNYYEDGNTNNTSRWMTTTGDMTKVSNMVDHYSSNNRVIHIADKGAQYKLNIDYSTVPTDKTLSFKMLHTTGDYAFYVHLNTDNGLRVIKYTNRPTESGTLVSNWIKVGIANRVTQGAWSTVTLDFAADLANAEAGNTINSVEAFKARGSLLIDNIKSDDCSSSGNGGNNGGGNAQTTHEITLCQNKSAYVSTLYSLGMTINSTTAHGSVLSDGNDFVGAVLCAEFANVASSSDVLDHIKANAFSGATGVIVNNNADGSIKAQYEVSNANTQAYAQLKSILQASGETSFTGYPDYSTFASIQDLYIDIYIQYVDATTTYIVVTVSDKSMDNVNRLNALVTSSIIAASNTQNVETDTFSYSGSTLKADILFVMDDSGSMSAEQTAASNAIVSTFGNAMTTKGVDWKATVIGTERSGNYLNRYISDPSENNITKLATQLKGLGLWGYDEVGLLKAYIHLNNGDISVRNSSKISMVYISDEPAHSRIVDLGGTDMASSYFVQNNIKVNVIIPQNLSNNNNLAYQMANATGGEVANIYNYSSGYNAMMDKIADDAAGSASQIVLTRTPIVSSIQVTVNGVVVPAITGWIYNSSNNSIVFNITSIPNSGDTINVTYNY